MKLVTFKVLCVIHSINSISRDRQLWHYDPYFHNRTNTELFISIIHTYPELGANEGKHTGQL